MRKRKRSPLNTNSYREMITGVLKGKTKTLAKTIADKNITDEKTIYNSILELGTDFYCQGWLQKGHERKVFND